MQRYTLDEARSLADRMARKANDRYCVVLLGEDYTVVPATDLKKLPSSHNRVVYMASPGPVLTESNR
ncbi:MAG: hypothetical protein IT208_07200 [Chthonomonadales bacterium]|nr:hypothetical protein [Chthonomonadales bacterium]